MPSRDRIVTLDAAQTLVRTRFDPGQFVVDCAVGCGIRPESGQGDLFNGMMTRGWIEYRAINETRDTLMGDAYWRRNVERWLEMIGEDPERVDELLAIGRELLYGPMSPYFSLFADTVPALDLLQSLNVRLAVVSNWDYSLERVLKALKIHDRFEFVLASLVEGVEKPESGLFEIALRRLNAKAEEVVHVGDNLIDDVEGAKKVGMIPILIDRSRTSSEGSTIHTLTALPTVLGWSC